MFLETASEFFEEVPEAAAFCRAVIDDPTPYLIYDGERFEKLVAGIILTTEVDLQGESFDEQELQALEAQVARAPLWLMEEHDPQIQPIGRIIAAKLFEAPSGVSFVAGVSGAYDIKAIRTFDEMGLTDEALRASHEVLLTLDDESAGEKFRISVNPFEIDPGLIAEVMPDAPSLIDQEIGRDVRKGLPGALAILSVAVPVLVLSQIPFIKKYQEAMGGQAAVATADALRWIHARLLPHLAKRLGHPLPEFYFTHKNCRVQCLVMSKDPVIIEAAVKSMEEAAGRALVLLENAEDLRIDKLVYYFDHLSVPNGWRPLHAVSQTQGVISNRPHLIALDSFRGFSIGGSRVKRLRAPELPPAETAKLEPAHEEE